MDLTIWHNPRCSKSRQTLTLLEERGLQPIVRLYLDDVPSKDEIAETLLKLDKTARDLLRKGEAEYKDMDLANVSGEADLIAAMHKAPKLIERPIVFTGEKAVVGRPPESVLDIL